MLGWHLVLVTVHRGLQVVLSKTIRIGGTKSHMQFSYRVAAWVWEINTDHFWGLYGIEYQ